MRAFRYLVGRFARMIAVVLAIVVGNFLLIHAAPGDPASVIAGQSGAADPQFVAGLRRQFGLDSSLSVQLATYLKNIFSFDLGMSHRQQRTVAGLIAERLPATILLTTSAFVFALIAGVALGTLAARRAGTMLDTFVTAVSLFFYATPIFWTGLLFILVFSVWLDVLPGFGIADVTRKVGWPAQVGDVARHLVLPSLTLGLFYMAVYARLARSAVLEVLQQDHVRTARAKGATEARVLVRHVLRNAMLPVITYAGIQAGQLVGGAVLVETVFAWPGIGRLAFDALLARDYQLLLGVFLCTGILVVVFNLITDLVYVLVDPRMELA